MRYGRQRHTGALGALSSGVSGDHERRRSLRRGLLTGLALSFTVAWVGMVVLWFAVMRGEVAEVHDAQLVQYALVIAELPSRHDASVGEFLVPRGATPWHRYERFLVFQLFDRDGTLLHASRQAPEARLGGDQPGFSDGNADGQAWRVFTMHSADDQFRLHVAENEAIRDGLVHELIQEMVLPLLIGLPLAAFLGWLMVGRALRPLDVLGAEIARPDRELLGPIETADVPREVSPLVHSLNGLLDRLRDALASERRFTADAAHELRTPLATLKVQAQMAQSARRSADRDRALDGLVALVDRTSHLVNQMLVLARSEAAGADSGFEPVDLAEVACDVAGDLRGQARERDMGLVTDAPAGALVLGDRALLMSLLRNLIDNALRYSSPATDVAVRVHAATDDVMLEVEDRGPGIPASDRERAFERFHRGLGTSEVGSGLGLSIVRRVVELHGGTIILRDSGQGHGLIAEVRLPRIRP